MADLSEEIHQAYEAAQAAELLARQHPDHLEHALKASEQFERAAILSQRQAQAEEYAEEVRRLAFVLADYYFAQMHKSRGWYAYERHDCITALAELEHEREHFERVTQNAEALIPELSDSGTAFLEPQLQSWKLSLESVTLVRHIYSARRAWDAGNTVEAIDWYRHSISEAERLLELEKNVPPRVNPAARRVMRGNLYSTLANASQAAAKILLDRTKSDERSLYDFSREEGLQLLGHFLDAYDAGTAAISENPEWEQLRTATQSSRKNIEKFLNNSKENWGLICSRFQGNRTLEMLMRHLDPEHYAMAKDNNVLRQNKGAQLWAIGSFWVFAFVCVTAMIILLASLVSPWVVLPSIIAIEVILLFIGALTLRTTKELSQVNFLKLIALAARFQFRSLLVLSRDKGPTNLEQAKPDEHKDE